MGIAIASLFQWVNGTARVKFRGGDGTRLPIAEHFRARTVDLRLTVSPTSMRAILCHNPKSGDGDHSKTELLDALEDAGIDARYCSIKSGDSSRAARTGRPDHRGRR